jgi:hypothetical protein
VSCASSYGKSSDRSAAPEIVLHMAAQSQVRDGYRDPVGTFATNVMGSAASHFTALSCGRHADHRVSYILVGHPEPMACGDKPCPRKDSAEGQGHRSVGLIQRRTTSLHLVERQVLNATRQVREIRHLDAERHSFHEFSHRILNQTLPQQNVTQANSDEGLRLINRQGSAVASDGLLESSCRF